MLKVALTGNIACGKSSMLRFFKSKGIPVIDADKIVSRLYRKTPIKERILALFGTLDKNAIASQAFSSKAKRTRLEQLLHPLVRQGLLQWLERMEKQGKKIAIAEVPLLFEAKMEPFFDAVIAVHCSSKAQISRLLRAGLSREQARQRVAAQLPSGEKVKKADFAIDNSTSLAEARKQAEKIFRELNG